MASTIDDIARRLVEPRFYADERAFHEGMTQLREHAPVVHVDARPGVNPFWAVTRHADVLAVERDDALWVNRARSVLTNADLEAKLRDLRGTQYGVRNLVHMDGDYHRAMRAIGASWFRPKVMRDLKVRIGELARRHVDSMASNGPDCEFVGEVALAFPGYVILSLLGLPEADYPALLRWTQELFGVSDDDSRRGNSAVDMVDVIADFNAYFTDVTARRRESPTDDLGSAIANARIDDRLLTDHEATGYYQIIAAAGHDTTKACLSGGLLALIEHPDELRRLQDDPSLLPSAVEEIIRWTTPVKTFMRTATADTVLGGVPLDAGTAVAMIYPAANRDPAVFPSPMTFDVARTPNRHLGFGAGAHFCLGAALARLEITAFFEELIPRLESIELAGEPAYLPTVFIGGLKRLPVRCRIR
ncbi:cytochrome P450 [Mycolicibacterium arabiense]|nr:cytochrome P450 [Mycolicibacterium arabiense]